MLWRATRASVGFLNKAARDIIEEYAKNITGKTATQPRWKSCVSSAAGSFSAAVGKMYVSKYFKEDERYQDSLNIHFVLTPVFEQNYQ